MFKEFNVKFEDAEIIGGADNLLEGTGVTKVILRGDNKLSSLDSTFKDCSQLDTVDGELDLNGISDIDSLLENSNLVTSIDLKNVNNKDITANNAFSHVNQINIGGETYNKEAIQNIISSREWTFNNINYIDTVGEDVVTHTPNISEEDENNYIVINDALEQKARDIEIKGQTYQNLIQGKEGAELLADIKFESIDGSPSELEPPIDHPVCVEVVEGQTYQNLIEGKGEYNLTDTYNATWTESNSSFEDMLNMIEIPEIFGNTVQGYANVVSAQQIVDAINGSIASGESWLSSNNNETFVVEYSGASVPPTSSDNFIQLKANTTYTIRCYRLGSTQNTYINCYLGNTYSTAMAIFTGTTFTTDSSGKVLFYPTSVQGGQLYLRVVEGSVNLNSYNYNEYDLNYIQSVGDLYVDEEGSPILDDEGNEQYKLEVVSSNSNLINYEDFLDNEGYMKSETGYKLKKPFYVNAGDKFTLIARGRTLSQDYSSVMFGDRPSMSVLNDTTFFMSNGITFTFVKESEEMVDKRAILTANKSGWITYIRIGNSGNKVNLVIEKFGLFKGEVTLENYESYNENKTTILMPQPLRRVSYTTWSKNHFLEDILRYDNRNGKYVLDRASEVIYLNSYLQDIANGMTTGVEGFRRYNLFIPVKGYSIEQVNELIQLQNSTNYRGIAILSGWGESINNVYWATKRCYSFVCGLNNGSLVYNLTFLLEDHLTREDLLEMLKDSYFIIGNYKDAFRNSENRAEVPYFETVEVKTLEKPMSLETYSPKTYISTNTEIQPSKMNITNKRNVFFPLGLQANKDYTLQLDSVGKDDKPITVNLGGSEITTQPVNDTSTHHKVVIKTPSTLTSDKLELSGEGVVVNDVMLFEGGEDVIKQEVDYVEGIKSIGEAIPLGSGVCGKNKFNSEIEVGSISTSGANENKFYWNFRTIGYIKCNGNTDYTVSSNFFQDYFYAYYDENKTFISYFNSRTTTTSPLNAKYLRLAFYHGTINELPENLWVQLEEGKTKTEYEPYINYDGHYKIDILSWNGFYNLYDINVGFSSNGFGYVYNGYIEVVGGQEYYSYDDSGVSTQTMVSCYDTNKNSIGAVVTPSKLPINCRYIKPDHGGVQPKRPMVVKGNQKQPYSINLYKAYTKSILLPQPLNKIGDVSDRLYWDEDKGHYCIEQKFAKGEVKNITWNILNQNTEFIYFTGSRLSNVFKHSDKGLCNKLPCYQQYGLAFMTKEGIAFRDSSVYIVLSKTRDILTLEQLETFIDDLFAIWELETYNIIDLPHLNKKYSLDTYMPTTYLECSNSPMQPSKMYFETDKLKYKPLVLETNKDYTIQFECSKNSDTNVKVVLGGVEEEIEAVVGTNHINITTPEELSSDRLYISGQGNKVSDVMLVDGDMKQSPEYFDGIESVGELQEDGKYKIEIGTDNGVKNLVDTNPNSWKVIDGSVNIIQKTPIKVRPNTKYTAYWDSSRWLLVFKCDSDGNTSTTYVHKNTGEFEFITDDSTEYIIARMDHSDSDLNYAHSSNLRIFKGETDFGYEGYQKHRQHYNIPILLAEPLRKIGDVADRIYWNHTQEKYCIERNVGVVTYNGDETWTVQTLSSDYNDIASGFYTSIENAQRTTTDTSLVINDGGFICYSDAVYSYKPRAIGINRSGRLYLSLYNDEFGYDGVANSATKLSLFKEYLSNNPVTVYYSYTTPIIEEVECEGEVVNLPRLHQREETCFNVTTGNLRPSNIMLEYKNI